MTRKQIEAAERFAAMLEDLARAVQEERRERDRADDEARERREQMRVVSEES